LGTLVMYLRHLGDMRVSPRYGRREQCTERDREDDGAVFEERRRRHHRDVERHQHRYLALEAINLRRWALRHQLIWQVSADNQNPLDAAVPALIHGALKNQEASIQGNGSNCAIEGTRGRAAVLP